jgi:hypothetical protein
MREIKREHELKYSDAELKIIQKFIVIFEGRCTLVRALINVKLPMSNEGNFMTPAEFRKVMKLMGLQPIDMPEDANQDILREYFLTRAATIINRIPEEKQAFSKDNLVYASELGDTLFMVTAHTTAVYRFRLLNPRIEVLQQDCKDLIILFNEHNAKNNNEQIEIGEEIRILEHGLEDSSIYGKIVKDEWDFAKKIASREVQLMKYGIYGFIFLSSISILHIIYPPKEDHTFLSIFISFLNGQIDRFSTAMLTIIFTAFTTILHIRAQVTTVIKWTAKYEKDN